MINGKRRSVALIVFGIYLLLAPTGSWAQEFRGSIAGRVVDPSGAAVPGTEVSVTNTATNITAKTVTDAAGEYTLL